MPIKRRLLWRNRKRQETTVLKNTISWQNSNFIFISPRERFDFFRIYLCDRNMFPTALLRPWAT